MLSDDDVLTVRHPGRPGLYLITSAVLLVLLVVGFSRTFFLRPLFESGPLPGYLIVHGSIETAWVFGFLVQVRLASRGRYALHRRLGPVIAALGAVAGLGGLYVSLRLIENIRAGIVIPDGSVEQATSGAVWNVALALLFGTYLTLAVLLRRRAALHKRLMLLALIASTVPPAVVRLPLAVGTAVTVAILAALIGRNVALRKRPHPVSVAGALLFVAVFLTCMGLVGNLEWAQRIVFGTIPD